MQQAFGGAPGAPHATLFAAQAASRLKLTSKKTCTKSACKHFISTRLVQICVATIVHELCYQAALTRTKNTAKSAFSCSTMRSLVHKTPLCHACCNKLNGICAIWVLERLNDRHANCDTLFLIMKIGNQLRILRVPLQGIVQLEM